MEAAKPFPSARGFRRLEDRFSFIHEDTVSRRILISVDPYEARAALLDGDRLINVEVEGTSSVKRKGNIYRGRVTAVQGSLGAAFVDYGAHKDGFLPLEDVSNKSLVRFSGHSKTGGRTSLRVGDPVLVQVTKEEFGKKGATLTTYVSLPGRFVVLMPFSERTGVSRKLPGDERARLRQIASRLEVPEGCGFIVRTVGEEEDLQDLQADLDALVEEWRSIEKAFHDRKTVGEIHAEISLARRFVRDYLTSDVTEVWVEDEVSHRELAEYLQSHMPDRLGILRSYQGNVPLFLKYGVEGQIDALLQNRVSLPSGGSIVIAQTEALVAIDVNSGRTRQADIEATALKTNLEAAREIARQLVLRDLGGIVVVDFIDMESEAHRRAVEQEIRSSLKADKARLTFTPIQEFGLLILTRQRLRQSVDSGITLPCPTCQGSGRVRSPSLQAMAALRRIRERLATSSGNIAYVEVTVPLEVAHFLGNRKRDALLALERKFDVIIDILGDPTSRPDAFHLSALADVPASRRALYGAEDDEEEASPSPEEAPVATPLPDPGPGSPRATEGGRQRSFLKGLLTRVLGLEDEEEARAEAPVRQDEVRWTPPSIPAPPPPAPRKAPPPPVAVRAPGTPDPSARPVSQPAPDPASGPSEEPARRKRRRRRRKPGSEERPGVPMPDQASAEPRAEGSPPSPVSVPPPGDGETKPPREPDETPEAPAGQGEGEAPRKKRRRRRRKPASPGTPQEGSGGIPVGPSEASETPGPVEVLPPPPPQTADAGAPETRSAPPKKSASRRRRTPRSAAPAAIDPSPRPTED